jgi:pimeloyl-ACP methyl ester carboxylesterase
MRALLVFCLGGLAAVALILIVESVEVSPVLDQTGYHFQTCVFSGPDFPTGDLDNGSLLRRAFVPVRASTRFFDAQFREVTQAAQPGRYGAVVEIRFAGLLRGHRYITLYRTLAPVPADLIQIPITAQFPPEFGINPEVLAAQQPAIGAALQNMLLDYEDGAAPESLAILLAGLAETSPQDPPQYLHADADTRNAAWWYELRARLGLAPTYKFIVDLPTGYDTDPARRWPLVVFLHHSAAGGNDLDVVRHCALMGLIERGRQLPAVVVAPQCPAAQTWSVPVLEHLLDSIEKDYRIDLDRVYLTGVSAGGDTTWDWALIHPDRFAALVPMSGESEPRDAGSLRGIPVWGFQGAKDAIVPPSQMAAMVEAVRQAGGHAHLTVFPDAGHDCWDAAYSNDALWTWLFAQKRGQPEVVTPGTPSP